MFIWVSRSLNQHVLDGSYTWLCLDYLFFIWYFSEVFFIIFVILLAVSLSSVLCGVGCMDSFTFVNYMFLCFSWFATFMADYIVVFYVQHPCSYFGCVQEVDHWEGIGDVWSVIFVDHEPAEQRKQISTASEKQYSSTYHP